MRQNSHRKRSPPRDGFTLLELVIVVFLLGFLSAVAAPRFGSAVSRYRVEAAADRIAGDLEYGRRAAITTGKATTVTFDIGTNSYALTGVPHPDHPGQAYSVNLDDTPYPAVLFSVSLGAGGTGTAVVFDIYGRPDFGGSIIVASGDDQLTVDVNADLGRATVQ